MASISIPDELKAQTEARAIEGGFASVDEFVEALLRAEAAGAPDGLTVDSDEDLKRLVERRIDGPWVEVNAADFAQMRAKFQKHLDGLAGRQS